MKIFIIIVKQTKNTLKLSKMSYVFQCRMRDMEIIGKASAFKVLQYIMDMFLYPTPRYEGILS